MNRSKSLELTSSKLKIRINGIKVGPAGTNAPPTPQLLKVTSVPVGKEHQKKKKVKPFEMMPNFLDTIGMNCPEAQPDMIQFARELAGGLISHFNFFQNVFNDDTYVKKRAKLRQKTPPEAKKTTKTEQLEEEKSENE